MGKITCPICGMSSFVKQDGVFVCSTCGHKYSADEIRSLLSSNEQNIPKANGDDAIHDKPNSQLTDFSDYQRSYHDYVQWKARKKYLFSSGLEAFALKADGTVLSTVVSTKQRIDNSPWRVMAESYYIGKLTEEWSNVTEILKILPGGLLGKRSDGTLCFAGKRHALHIDNQPICTNAKHILCDFNYPDPDGLLFVYCLNENGTVSYVGNSAEKQAELSSWKNIVEIFPAFIPLSNKPLSLSYKEHFKEHFSEIIGIKEDGSLALTNECVKLWPNAKTWANIKKVFCKWFLFSYKSQIPILYGIKSDGGVISAIPALCDTMEGNDKETVFRLANVYGLASVIDIIDFSFRNDFEWKRK